MRLRTKVVAKSADVCVVSACVGWLACILLLQRTLLDHMFLASLLDNCSLCPSPSEEGLGDAKGKGKLKEKLRDRNTSVKVDFRN